VATARIAPEARRSLEPWLRAPESCEWTRPGWRDGVVTWVNGELARRSLAPIREITQVRLWEFAQVLRLQSADARFYFKARPPSGAAEAPLTRRLAERHPGSMPDVVAIDRQR